MANFHTPSQRYYAVARYDGELPQIIHSSIRPYTDEGRLSAQLLCKQIHDSAGGYITFFVVEIVLPSVPRVEREKQPTKWWRSITPEGKLWGESSDEEEIRRKARPTDIIQRYYQSEPVGEWRDEA